MWGGLAYAYKYVSLNLSLIQGAHFTHSNMVSEQEKEQRRVDSRMTECTAVGAWIGLETSCLLHQIAAGDMEASGSSDNDLEVNRSGDNYMEASGFGDNGLVQGQSDNGGSVGGGFEGAARPTATHHYRKGDGEGRCALRGWQQPTSWWRHTTV
jgi:hypothetical protein